MFSAFVKFGKCISNSIRFVWSLNRSFFLKERAQHDCSSTIFGTLDSQIESTEIVYIITCCVCDVYFSGYGEKKWAHEPTIRPVSPVMVSFLFRPV